ncbi:MAG TPA: GNAT family N-acetyltransferase [Thermoplasmata archaeon]|nr:GNAT family N-acetyltransferase [Thermoplasmata archaeon]
MSGPSPTDGPPPTIEEEPSRGPTNEIREYLRRDPVRNSYVIHVLERERPEAQFWVARAGGAPIAHLLIDHSTPAVARWVYFSGAPAGARGLAEHLPEPPCVVTADPSFVGAVRERRSAARVISEDLMLLESSRDALAEPVRAVRLGPEHTEEYARMVVPAAVPRTPEILEANRQHLARWNVYGIFLDGVLAAVAAANIRTDDLWIISGVETLPQYRRRGLATEVTSAVARDALRATGRAGLFVASDNHAAIGLYRKLGFVRTGASAWIDCGSGLEP